MIVVVLEISGATEKQIQRGFGQAITEFCKTNKGAGITASVLTKIAADKVISYINEEE